jgi:hypothetical protein
MYVVKEPKQNKTSYHYFITLGPIDTSSTYNSISGNILYRRGKPSTAILEARYSYTWNKSEQVSKILVDPIFKPFYKTLWYRTIHTWFLFLADLSLDRHGD